MTILGINLFCYHHFAQYNRKKEVSIVYGIILALGLTTTYAREGAEKVISSMNRQSGQTLTWYKGSTDTSNRIAEASDTGVEYYGEYCNGPSPCTTSSRGELDQSTGDLTISAAALDDEDDYYYVLSGTGGDDQGLDVVTNLYVYGKQPLFMHGRVLGICI